MGALNSPVVKAGGGGSGGAATTLAELMEAAANPSAFAVMLGSSTAGKMEIAVNVDLAAASTWGRLSHANHTTDVVSLGHFDFNSSDTVFGLKFDASGKTTLNSVTGQTLDLAIGGTSYGVLSSTSLLVGNDTDFAAVLGRMKLANHVSDRVFLGHFDHNSSSSVFGLCFVSTGATILNTVSGTNLGLAVGGTDQWRISSTALFPNGSAEDFGTTSDRVKNSFTLGYWEGLEMTPPSAAAANCGRVYFDDSGGKTRLMVIFATGAAQQIAIEP